MSAGAAEALAALAYLVPVAVVLAARARRDAEPWEVCADVAAAVSLDLLALLLLATVVRLEYAAIASRPLWLAGGLFAARRRRPELPAFCGPRAAAAVLSAAAAAAATSAWLSRTYAFWDRQWHIPLVASLRAQTVPFANVFEPPMTLHYHYAGDVVAAVLQALSGDALHASLALSLAHDVLFGLLGACLALALLSAGARTATGAAFGAFAVLLSGPATLLLRGRFPGASGGYSTLNMVTMSFRPHVVLAELLLVGLLATFAGRLRAAGRPPPLARAGPGALATCMALALADEASLAFFGLALGAAWLVAPGVAARGRARGALALFGLALAVAATMLAFEGALAPGGPVAAVRLTAARSPGFGGPPLPLADLRGRVAFAYDAFGVLGAGALVLAFAARARDRASLALVAFCAVLIGLSVFGLTRVEINGDPLEAHRFMTAAYVAMPLLALHVLPHAGRGSPEAALGLAALIVPALSTALWVKDDRGGVHSKMAFGGTRIHALNCRDEAGARLGEEPRRPYVDAAWYYIYHGCRPTFGPASSRKTQWSLRIVPAVGDEAYRAISQSTPPGRSFEVICPADPERLPASSDKHCAALRARGPGEPVGASLRRYWVESPHDTPPPPADPAPPADLAPPSP